MEGKYYFDDLLKIRVKEEVDLNIIETFAWGGERGRELSYTVYKSMEAISM